MKKKILLALSFLAVIGLSIGGTVAYFTAQDAEVATFAYGDVNVKQFQYERVVDANGKWISTGVVDQYGYTPDKIQEIILCDKRNTFGQRVHGCSFHVVACNGFVMMI